MNENEKEKENKNPSEIDSYEDYKEEEGENAGEASELDISDFEKSLSPRVCPTPAIISDSINGEDLDLLDSYEERKNLLLREKWLTVTGRKPRNIPTLRKYFEEKIQSIVFFGDQRPAEVEEKIRKRMLMKSKEIISRGINYGKVLQEIRLPILSSHLISARFLTNTEYCCTCVRSGEVQIRSISTGEEIMSLDTFESKKSLAARAVRSYPLDPEKLYFAGDAGIIQVFTLATGELLSSSDTYHGINNIDFSADGNYLGAVGKKGGVYFFDSSTLQVVSSRGWPCGADETIPGLEDSYHKLGVYGLKSHPEQNNLFASAGPDSTMKIWDVRTIAAIRSIRGPSVHGDGLDINGNNIITASWRVENSLSLWDFFSGRLIKQIPITNSPEKNLVAVGGSGFHDALILNIDTNEVECYFPSFKPIFSMDVRDNLMIYGGTESIVRIVELKLRRGRKVEKRQ